MDLLYNNMEEELNIPPEWKVTWDGGFWEQIGEAGTEIKVGKFFSWEDETWNLPSVYLCNEGLVADYCIAINMERLHAFLEKWNFQDEDSDGFSQRELEMISQEQPMDIRFQSEMACNQKPLESHGGCSICYIPASLQGDEPVEDPTVVQVMKHYGLDPANAWVIWRCSYGFENEEMESIIKTLDITFKRNMDQVYGESLGDLNEGDKKTIVHPLTGEIYELTVEKATKETLEHSIIAQPNMEFPTHFQALAYSFSPELEDCTFTLQDFQEGDSARMIKQSDDGPVASSMAIIGGSHNVTSINGGKVKTVCSSMHFDEEFRTEWVPVFRVKNRDDIFVNISMEQ